MQLVDKSWLQDTPNISLNYTTGLLELYLKSAYILMFLTFKSLQILNICLDQIEIGILGFLIIEKQHTNRTRLNFLLWRKCACPAVINIKPGTDSWTDPFWELWFLRLPTNGSLISRSEYEWRSRKQKYFVV